MDIKALEKIISDFKKANDYELEMKYNNKITKTEFDKIVDYYKKQKLELSNIKTLDIIFIYNKINYRITIEGDKNIDNYLKTSKVTREIIKEVLIKQNIKGYKPLIIDDYNLKINMKEEKPVITEKLITSLMKATEKPLKTLRQKNRYSFLAKDKTYRYDFTTVISNGMEDYELEI